MTFITSKFLIDAAYFVFLCNKKQKKVYQIHIKLIFVKCTERLIWTLRVIWRCLYFWTDELRNVK